MSREPKRVANLREIARRVGNLSGVKGSEYRIPQADAYFDEQRLPWGLVYEGTEEENPEAGDFNGSVEYALNFGAEIVFEYDPREQRTRMETIGNDLLAKARVMFWKANVDELGGLCFSVGLVGVDVHAFPTQKYPTGRGRLFMVGTVAYRCPTGKLYWPES